MMCCQCSLDKRSSSRASKGSRIYGDSIVRRDFHRCIRSYRCTIVYISSIDLVWLSTILVVNFRSSCLCLWFQQVSVYCHCGGHQARLLAERNFFGGAFAVNKKLGVRALLWLGTANNDSISPFFITPLNKGKVLQI